MAVTLAERERERREDKEEGEKRGGAERKTRANITNTRRYGTRELRYSEPAGK